MSEDSDGPADALELEKVRRHVRILVDLGRLAGEGTDFDRFLDQAVVQVARAVKIDHVKVLRYRREASDFIVAAGVGWRHGVVRAATLSADLHSAPGRSFQTAEPVIVHDFADQAEYLLSDFLRQHGIVSLANAPILTGGAAWGVLEVDSTIPRDFGHDTINFLLAAGALIGAFVGRYGGDPAADRLTAAMIEAQNREVLLRELQHRVRNNFQLILASIAIQKRRYPKGDIQRALDHVTSRINAMSLAHDQLAPGQGVQVVKLGDYLRALCQSIRRQVDGIEFDVDVDEIELTIDRAVALGLVVNEAATNSVKHAFGERGGRITVRLDAGIGYGEARLTVADDGHGIQDAGRQGSGLKLIASLARQLGATVRQQSSDAGTVTSLIFPVIG